MPASQRITAAGRIYIALVICAGAIILADAIATATTHGLPAQWLLLAALTLFTGSFTVKLPSLTARLSVSEVFVFTSLLLFGANAATLTVALDALIMSLRLRREIKSAQRVLFNVGAPVLAIWTSSMCFFSLLGGPLSGPIWHLEAIFLPLTAAALVYFLLNSGLIAIAISFELQRTAYSIWRNNFFQLGLNYFGGASVAALVVSYTQNINATVLGVIVPLLIVSYLSFRTSMGRLEDTERHLARVNALYMSTVETLAMAIDAKDQVTHGHIRRVQLYALALANALGLEDRDQLKALEAAALLHDTGKLAVPEYILNKPGQLTPSEFNVMKLHAGVGADILSSIPFPYPVVPIVRHHHEQWNGRGYPAGLASTDIPIGARILAVVDCFDALTSDRPYRAKLNVDEAFAILRERSGTMYDPLIVDTFIRVFSSIETPPNVPEPRSWRGSLAVAPSGSASRTDPWC